MHHANNAVIMQTEQLGRIEALEEELRSSRVKMVELELKTTEQDRVIAQLVGDNLENLQDNMRLTAHITSSSDRKAGASQVSPDGDDRGSNREGGSGDVELVGQRGISCFWRRFGRSGWGRGQ